MNEYMKERTKNEGRKERRKDEITMRKERNNDRNTSEK
jgi:hypothetical protein